MIYSEDKNVNINMILDFLAKVWFWLRKKNLSHTLSFSASLFYIIGNIFFKCPSFFFFLILANSFRHFPVVISKGPRSVAINMII